MAESVHYFLSNQGLTANTAVRAFGLASLGTIRSDSCIDNRSMPKGLHLIVDTGIVADRAGIGGITLFGTSRIRHFGLVLVPLCFDGYGLAGEFLITDGTVHDVIVGAVNSTCGLNFVLNDGLTFGVAESVDHFLLQQNFAADRAVLTFGLAGLGAGRLHLSVDCFHMNASPNAIYVFERGRRGSGSLKSGSLKIRPVRIFCLGRRDGYCIVLSIFAAILCYLIGFRLRTIRNDYLARSGRINICAEVLSVS